MYKEIENDVNIQCLLQKSRDGVLNNSNYQILDGKLWYKRRLVLPKESRFIPVILRECHDTKMGGYYDVLKTLKRVQQSFYWEEIYKRIQQYVLECSIFQTHRNSTFSPAGLVQPMPLHDRVWDDITLDFIERLPMSQGFNVIIVVVDRLSKYGHFMAMKHPFSTVDVAQKFIEGVIRHHGFPKSIVSDRDQIFLSAFWKVTFRLAETN